VNRPKSAWRIREKSAAAIPVRPWAARTVRRSRSSAQNGLELFGIGILMPQIAKHIATSPQQFFSFHRDASFNHVGFQ
jgi:hypothetical protein